MTRMTLTDASPGSLADNTHGAPRCGRGNPGRPGVNEVQAGRDHPAPTAGKGHPTPIARFHWMPVPQAGLGHPAPTAGSKHPAPVAGTHWMPAPGAGLGHPAPSAGGYHPAPTARALAISA
jgi:hypothetical protein